MTEKICGIDLYPSKNDEAMTLRQFYALPQIARSQVEGSFRGTYRLYDGRTWYVINCYSSFGALHRDAYKARIRVPAGRAS